MKLNTHAVGFLRRQYLIVLRRCAVLNSFGLVAAIGFVPHPVFAQGIVPDGRTATVVTTTRNVSDITTATIAGPNAFNSFSRFNVANGEIANLRLPSGTSNLINIVHDEASFIDGVLNSVKDGRIGGNIFFANPYGMVVGAHGVLNVGSISISTPTKAYVDSFFSAPGVPDPTAVGQLLDGTLPISPSGLISIRGRINAIDGIELRGGRVDIAGALETGARFSASQDFATVVNLNGLSSGTRLVERGGRILIAGDEGVSISGSVAADGSEQVAGGEISITSKGDIDLQSGALLSARGTGANSDGGRVTVVAQKDTYLRQDARIDAGAGDSGDGGHIELSGKGSVFISGGILEAAAPGGKAGSVLIDPTQILWTGSASDVFYNSGTSYMLAADQKIVLDNVVISTRNVGGAFTRNNIDSAVSIGNSGSIALTAPDIVLKNGTRLLANADNGKQAGDVTLTASLSGSGTASILLSNAQISGKAVTLRASSSLTDSSLAVSTGITPANAGASIDIDSSRIDAAGGNLQISAATVINASTNASLSLPVSVLRSTAVATVNVHGDVSGGGAPIASQLSSSGAIQLTSSSQVTTQATPNSPLSNLNGDAAVAVSDVSSTSTVHVGDATTLSAGGALSLSSSNAVNATATADASAAGSSAAGAAVAYSKIHSVTGSSIDGQASIVQAASLSVSANATNSATVTAKAAAQGAQQDSSGSGTGASLLSQYGDQAKTSDGGVKVAGALGISDLDNTTQAFLAASGTATVTGAATLSSKATSTASVTADASATNASTGVGVAVGINLAKSVNQAYLAQDIDAASLDVEALLASAPPAAGNVFSTTATSGAGATNVGVAGSLAVNLIDTSAAATVNTGATATLHGGAAALTSDDTAGSTAKALSSGAASGGRVGVGASIAVNVDANRSTAELQNGGAIDGSGGVSLHATLANTVDTEVEAGAAGGVAVTPAVAVAIVNDRTAARLGTGADLIVASGDVVVGATQSDKVTTKAAGNADGSKAAIGAAVAVNVVSDSVLATSERSVTATTGGVSFTALGDSASSAQAKASAAGGKTDDDAKSGKEDADVDSKVGKQMTAAKDQQSAAGVGDSEQQGDTDTATADKPSASTSEGKVSVAAAVGVNIATAKAEAKTADHAVITAGGTLALKAQNNTDGEAVADGSAVGSAAVGIGAGVAVNKVKSVNDAVVGLGAHDVHGLTVEATMKDVGGDHTNTMNADATAGAGASKVGLAGALALNLVDTQSEALITGGGVGSTTGGATVELHGGNASLTADDQTSVTGKAKANATAGKVGIGASVAVDVVANRSLAKIADGADVTHANNIDLTASGTHSVNTETDAGSAGGVSITPSVAVAVVNDRTKADIGKGGTLSLNGSLTIDAEQSSTITTVAKGDAGGEKAAIGAAVAVNVVNDDVDATSGRSITATTGGVSFTALGDSASSAQAKASAAGGKTDDDAKSGKEDADVDSKVGKQMTAAKGQQSAAGVGDSTQQGDTDTATADKPSASTSEGKVSVAAAIGVNIVNSKVSARTDDHAVITAGGTLALKAQNNTDGEAVADGSAVGSAAVGIGAGVAVNKVKSVNDAVVGLGAHDVHGLTVEATMKDVGGDHTNTMKAEATAGAGASKVGVAGSLALNLIDTESQAVLTGGGAGSTMGGATVEAHGGNVAFTADDQTSVTGKAKANATAGKVGIGASVAVDVVANSSLAKIADGADVTHANNIDLTASGTHSVSAETDAGSAGGVSITPSVALAIVDNQTKADLGKGGTLTLGGNLTVSADHSDSTTTDAKADAGGGSVAIGASLALNVVNDASTATTGRDVDSTGGSVAFKAHAAAAANAAGKASASGGHNSDEAGQNGEDATVDDKVAKQKKFGTDQQVAGSGNSSQSASSASSSEGKVAVAAGIGINVFDSNATAEIPDSRSITAHGAVTVEAKNNTDAKATADGTAVGSKTSGSSQVGIGAGVAVNTVTAVNKARVGAAHVTSDGLSVTAETATVGSDSTNTFETEAKSGAGGSKVGIAGSVALNVIHNTNQATIASGADVDAGGGDLTLRATNVSSTSAQALPGDQGVTGGKVGIGASVAINLITETTDASIADNAKVHNAGIVNIAADSKSDTNTVAQGGASGGVALDAVVALATLNQTTNASVGAGLATDAGGTFSVTSHSSGEHTATATGDTKSGNVGIGASAAVIVSNSTTSASIGRDVGTGGNLTVSAESERTYDTLATASAKGAASDTASKTTQNGGKASSVDTLEKNKDSQQGTQGGAKVQVAAAVGVTVMNDDTTAKVSGGRTLTVGGTGNVEVSATSSSDFASKGSGEALDPNAKVGIGVGVGLSIANNHTTAAIEDGTAGHHAHLTSGTGGVAIGDVTVAATSNQNQSSAYLHKLSAEGISGAGADKVAVAGSLAVANSNTTTTASIGDNTRIDVAGAIVVDAENTSKLSAKAWSGALSSSVGIGASVATVVSNNEYKASLGAGSDVGGTSLAITAWSHKVTGAVPFVFSDFASLDMQGLLGNNNYYTESISGAGGQNVAVDGAFAVNVFSDKTEAAIGSGAHVVTTGQTALMARNDVTGKAFAGAVAVGGKVGVGISSADIANTGVTKAHIDSSANGTQAGSISIAAQASQDLGVFGISAGGGGNVGVAGVLSMILSQNTVAAYADNGAHLSASSGNLDVTAGNSFTALTIAGGLAGGGTAGIGASAATNIVRNDTRASLGTAAAAGQVQADGPVADAAGTIKVDAEAAESAKTIVVSGGAAGTVGVGVGAAVNVFNTATTAYVIDKSKLNTNASGQNVAVTASDDTTLDSAGGILAIGGTVGVGAGADVSVLTKSTSAYVGKNAVINADGTVKVAAESSEQIASVTAAGSGAGTAAVAGAVSVRSITGTTTAKIDDGATVTSDGNVVVTADSAASIDMVAGAGALGGYAGVGASAGVAVVDQTTHATIGSASVTARGNAPAATYGRGYDISFGSSNTGNFKASDTGSLTDANHRAGSLGDLLTKTRNAPEHQASIAGLAVSANNKDQIRALTASGSASGIAAVSLAGDVHVVTADTVASIASGANINQAAGAAGTTQSVDVGAASDFNHVGIAGATAGAGAVGAGAGADVSVVSNTTQASISATRVDAQRNVSVEASGREDFVTTSLSAGLGGAAGVAGAVSVISVDDTTKAFIGSNSTVNAGGNVTVAADDQTNAVMITGSLGVGYGGVGVGGSIGVTTFNKDTEAYIGSGATVDAKGGGLNNDLTTYTGSGFSTTGTARGIAVQATSSEDSLTVGVAGGGGFYAGIAGAVSVQTVNSKTEARIDDNAKINTVAGASGANGAQDVNVTARNQTSMKAFNGGVAVGAGALAGSVDVGTIQNDTTAQIGDGVTLNAQRDAVVNALGQKNISSTVASAAGGVVGVAGSVSVYSVGRGLGQDGKDRLHTDNGDTTTYADSQAASDSIDSILSGYNDSRVQSVSSQAQAERAGVSSGSALNGATVTGNTARVGNATITTQRDTAVHAVDGVSFDARAGSLAAGAVGIGAGIVVASVQESNQAYVQGSATISASRDIIVNASTSDHASGLAFAGSVGLIGADAAVAVISDNTVTRAYVQGEQLHSDHDTRVQAGDQRTVDAEADGAAIGAAAAGASIATARVGGSTSAYLESGAGIGQSAAKAHGATVAADSTTTANAYTRAAAGGLGAGLSGSAATAASTPTVDAHIDGGSHYVTNSLTVQASGNSQAHADSLGISVAGGLAVGASVAQASAGPTLHSYLGNNTIVSAHDVSVTAAEAVSVNPAVTASATGAAGALVGVSATEADATSTSNVEAHIGNGSQLTVPGAVLVQSTNNTSQSAESLGITVGIVAAGSNTADAGSLTSSHADIDNNVLIAGPLGSVTVSALGTDVNMASSKAGSGGVVSGSAAEANTASISNTHANVGTANCGAAPSNCGISTGTFTVLAQHETQFNGKVDSTNASVVGASGASASHRVDSTVESVFGAGATVLANDISITANNLSKKFWWGAATPDNSFAASDGAAWNVNSGSGGLLNGAAGKSDSEISMVTRVDIGDSAYFHVLMPTSGSGSFKVDANSTIVAYDKVKLDSGGAIAIAEADSLINVNRNDMLVTLGSNSTVVSDSGDINIGSRADVALDARSAASAYGLAGAPSGEGYANYHGNSATEIKDGALLLSQDTTAGAINVSAGKDSQQRASRIVANSSVNLWNDTAFPINSTPDAQSNVTSVAAVKVDGASSAPGSVESAILASGDVGLNADRGQISTSAVGIGKDLYREAAAAVASGISNLFGGGDVSFDIHGGSTSSRGSSNVNVNGTVLSGLYRESATQINVELIDLTHPGGPAPTDHVDPNHPENWSWQLVFSTYQDPNNPNPNPRQSGSTTNPYIQSVSASDAPVSTVSPSSQLQARIDTLSTLARQYASDPVASAAYNAEIMFLKSKQAPQGISQPMQTERAASAVQLVVDTNKAITSDQLPITGDPTSSVQATKDGSIGTLLQSYDTIKANNLLIDNNNPSSKGYLQQEANFNSANASYIQLGTYKSTAQTGIDNVNTQIGLIGHIATDTLSATGYLGALQSDTATIGSLVAKRTRSGAESTQLVDTAKDIATQMTNLKTADASIVSSLNSIHSSLLNAGTIEVSLADAFKAAPTGNPATSADQGKINSITSLAGANSTLIADFNTAPGTGSTNASSIAAHAANIATAAATAQAEAVDNKKPNDATNSVANASDVMNPAATAKLISLPDIFVKLGNVNVNADTLTGSGSLKAPGDAKIIIRDNAPASLDVGALTIDSNGGNVKFNGYLVNNLTDLQRAEPNAFIFGTAPTLTFVTRANGAAGAPSIQIISNYDPSAYCCMPILGQSSLPSPWPGTTYGETEMWKWIAAPAPDINLKKPITNLDGSVAVTSAAGDIYSDSTINAGTISILARNGDYVQQYISGFKSVAGEPYSNVQGGSGTLVSPANPVGNGITANGNIFISARYVNINGLVQSGIVNYHLDLPTDANLQFTGDAGTLKIPTGYTNPLAAGGVYSDCGSLRCATYNGYTIKYDPNWWDVGKTTQGRYLVNKAYVDGMGITSMVPLVVDTQAYPDFGAISASYDPSVHKIVLDGTSAVRGGYIQLFGQIINTADGTGSNGSGKLAVLDGYGRVSINNQSSLPIVLKTIDTGADPSGTGRGIAGVIDITDVQYVGFDAASSKWVAPAIHTVISRNSAASEGGAVHTRQTGMWDASGNFCPTCELTDGIQTKDGSGNATSIAMPWTTNGAGSVVTPNALDATGRTAVYNPQAGLRYVYMTAQEQSTTYQWVYSGTQFFGSSSLRLHPSTTDMSVVSGPNYGPLTLYPGPNDPKGTFLSYTAVDPNNKHKNNLDSDSTYTHPAGVTVSGSVRRGGYTYTNSDAWSFVSESSNCDWYSLCITQTYTSYWNEAVGQTTITTNSVKADNPINIQFMGWNQPLVSVSSPNAAVTLSGPIKNHSGTTTIDAASIGAVSNSALIDTTGLSLTARNGSIGSAAQALPLLSYGTVNATANQGSVYLNELAGDMQIGSITASGAPVTIDGSGHAVAVDKGKVVLQANGDLVGMAGSSVQGERVELTSVGGEITSQDPGGMLKVYAGYTSDLSKQPYYGLKASAQGDIAIAAQQCSGGGCLADASGDMLVDTITSAGGNVRLSAPGRILDNNPIETIDQRVWGELLNFWDSVGLRAANTTVRNAKLATAINALENSRTQDYNLYWQIRNSQNPPAAQGMGWTYTASAAERSAIADKVRRANPSATATDINNAVNAFQVERTSQYWSLSAEIAAFDPMVYARSARAATVRAAHPTWTQIQVDNQVLADESAGLIAPVSPTGQVSGFTYVAAATERSPYETTGAWTDLQLAVSINPGLLKNITDTNPVIKAPNVSGHDVTITAGSSLGNTKPSPVIVPYTPDPSTLTDAQKVALAAAEYSDYTFNDTLRQVEIAQRVPVNFKATGGLTAAVTDTHVANSDVGNAYLASLGDGRLTSITADGEVRIKVKGSIISTQAPSVPVIRSGDLILESGNGGIGYIPGDDSANPVVPPTVAPLRIALHTGAALTARAAENVNIVTGGDFDVAGIYSRGDISLNAGGSILNAFPGTDLRMLGQNLYLTAATSVGDAGSPFNVGTTTDGRINATAGHDVYLNGPTSGPIRSYFNIGDVTAADRIRLSADGDAVIAGAVASTGSAGVSVTAGKLDILDGAQLDAGLGTVDIATTGDAIVTGISTGNATGNAVRINSTAGRILDGGDTRTDITATAPGAVVTLTSRDGVGTATRLPSGAITATPNPLEINAAMLNSNVIGGGFQATTTGMLTIGSVTATGDINLSGNAGVGAGALTSTGGSVSAVSSNGSVVIGAINADAFNLSAPGLIQATVNPIGSSLTGSVTGSGGTPAAQVNLNINGNVPTTFTNFSVNNGNLILAGIAPLNILQGYLGNRLTVTSPVANVLLDAGNPSRENVDAKIYVPGNTFSLGLANRLLSTSAYILYSGTEFETHSPAGTDVTVESAMLGELAKLLGFGQFRMPQPPGQPVPAIIDISGSVVSVGEAMLQAGGREQQNDNE